MPNDFYQPTRRDFLKTTGLALAGSLVPTSIAALAQQGNQQRYDVKFEVRDENDRRYSSIANPRFDERVKNNPKTTELMQRTAQEIREVYERLVQSNS